MPSTRPIRASSQPASYKAARISSLWRSGPSAIRVNVKHGMSGIFLVGVVGIGLCGGDWPVWWGLACVVGIGLCGGDWPVWWGLACVVGIGLCGGDWPCVVGIGLCGGDWPVWWGQRSGGVVGIAVRWCGGDSGQELGGAGVRGFRDCEALTRSTLGTGSAGCAAEGHPPTMPRPTMPRPTMPRPTMPRPTMPRPTMPRRCGHYGPSDLLDSGWRDLYILLGMAGATSTSFLG